MPNKGFRGFRALSPASNFVSIDNDALRNSLLGIAATVSGNSKKKKQFCMKAIFLQKNKKMEKWK
jgi:hypothetical protein